ncbi:unnamed protein product, partial [Ascophyllum nodosum]
MDLSGGIFYDSFEEGLLDFAFSPRCSTLMGTSTSAGPSTNFFTGTDCRSSSTTRETRTRPEQVRKYS